MSRICQNCQKTVVMGRKIGRARQELNYRSPKLYKPNLHAVRIPYSFAQKRFGFNDSRQGNAGKVRLTLCTKCLRLIKQLVSQDSRAVALAI